MSPICIFKVRIYLIRVIINNIKENKDDVIDRAEGEMWTCEKIALWSDLLQIWKLILLWKDIKFHPLSKGISIKFISCYFSIKETSHNPFNQHNTPKIMFNLAFLKGRKQTLGSPKKRNAFRDMDKSMRNNSDIKRHYFVM